MPREADAKAMKRMEGDIIGSAGLSAVREGEKRADVACVCPSILALQWKGSWGGLKRSIRF